MEINEARMNEFLGKMINDLGAAASASLVLTGDKLGLYKTLAFEGPLNSEELARRTGTTERYIREWLAAQAASGYVEYDSEKNRFWMTPEQTLVFADENSPVNMTGGYYALASVVKDEPKVSEVYRTGEGISWGDHDSCLNPLGRVYYSFSATVCTPSALSQEGGMSLGAQAGEKRLRDVALKAGFTHFRRAKETPFNMILEARP